MKKRLIWLQWVWAMGLRYIGFRMFFEIKRRGGWLKRSFPVDVQFRSWIGLNDWRNSAPPFFFHSRESINIKKRPQNDSLKEKADRILAGSIQFFNGEWKSIPSDGWLTNPSSGFVYPKDQHWSGIPDFRPEYGDIKYVWERSRFTFVQTILRYDAAFDKDSSAWFFNQIDSWISHNPINQGPNYRCSQEISLRIFNWLLGLYFYRYSPHLTEERFQKIIFHIYWQVKHIRANIHFSRIAVRNNHAISETLALFTAGLMFPFFEEAGEWKLVGKRWLEEEIAYQIYDDGSYLQFSFNYHRVVIQLLTWAISLAHHHKVVFKTEVYDRAYGSLRLLLTCQDPVTGQLPNYGANDGSLFFSWNDQPFRDFRPALDTLHFLLTGHSAFHFDDCAWFGIVKSQNAFSPVVIPDGVHVFKKGGIYVFRRRDLLVWLNCVGYKDRPSQADNLHLDIWHKGKNVLRDAGSYRYNADPSLVGFFFGTESHNTIMLDENDQMIKGDRFIWLSWADNPSAHWFADGENIVFKGSVNVYRYIGDITHHRTVTIAENSVTVTDHITGAKGKMLKQLWHIDSDIENTAVLNCLSAAVTKYEKQVYYSPTYGVLEPAPQIEFRTHQHTITTQIVLT